MAFAPDISGVCNIGGTLVITSNPMRIAKLKIYKDARISLLIFISFV
jgi:hypothetical protein